ncbi:MAG: inositol monophosphatase family protein [Desulfobacteraceae bacterium]
MALIAMKKGKEILSKFPTMPSIRYKSDPLSGSEIFTEADIEINEAIIDHIHKSYPSDSIIGEERSLADKIQTDRFWLVDPIDGTRSFIESRYGSSIMLSYIAGGKPIFGAIYDISKDRHVLSLMNAGTFIIRDEKPEPIEMHRPPQKVLACNPYGDAKLKEALIKALNLADVTEVESSGLRAFEIAQGNASLMVSLPGSAKIWDTAPGFVMLNEIGGCYTDINGKILEYSLDKKTHKDGAIASFGIDHEKATALVKNFIARDVRPSDTKV